MEALGRGEAVLGDEVLGARVFGKGAIIRSVVEESVAEQVAGSISFSELVLNILVGQVLVLCLCRRRTRPMTWGSMHIRENPEVTMSQPTLQIGSDFAVQSQLL